MKTTEELLTMIGMTAEELGATKQSQFDALIERFKGQLTVNDRILLISTRYEHMSSDQYMKSNDTLEDILELSDEEGGKEPNIIGGEWILPKSR